ncbi:hypothetical protein NQU96_04435 [Pseudoalteromonas elyakovii]|mgnify:CR=1 FL=1|uniref:Uncharacterized protein n=1 Tax=Pseudoalteromonas gelatinilytica TaxID=1703256 RepID=A0ABQ1U2Q8_9GAMM|nr:hypothetical protein [Pseudoalteromonas profundi]MDC3188977.1 hypothetical protein [Pseudoalteromonas elyakovii]GGF07102.1 hypothetical protein GCM10008027_35030 [Pseudoalteromonas profundi]|tara:strand:- start:112 stop:414 length:303 start_codon:yes stop_codon:yes gene_type:complete
MTPELSEHITLVIFFVGIALCLPYIFHVGYHLVRYLWVIIGIRYSAKERQFRKSMARLNRERKALKKQNCSSKYVDQQIQELIIDYCRDTDELVEQLLKQ